MKTLTKTIYQNLPNAVSILGVLPLVFLFTDGGAAWLIPLIIYNNIMDDLDGILARELSLKSEFGARMDNLADSVSHTILLLFVSYQYGTSVLICAMLPISAFMIRSVSRLGANNGGGSATNELIRHMLFTLVFAELFSFNVAAVLIILFVTHTLTMLWPLKMSFMIRSMTTTTWQIALVNVALVLVWVFPISVIPIGIAFAGSYVLAIIRALIPVWSHDVKTI